MIVTDGVVQHAMARSLLSWSIDVQFYHDAIANQIVSFAGICQVPVLSVDSKLGVHGHLFRSYLDCRGKCNRLLDAMKVKITGDVVVWRCRFDLCRSKRSFGKLRDVKKVRRLEMFR